jgi:hypothetical protein
MKYPVGTIFRPPKEFDWSGEILEYETDTFEEKYVIQWDDFSTTHSYSEEYLEEVIHHSLLTYKLPYTINHDFDEELFSV